MFVTDHGPGIPPHVLEKVFDWFETNSLGSHHRGTGIGLSLVRSFVELHGGTVGHAFGRRLKPWKRVGLEFARRSPRRSWGWLQGSAWVRCGRFVFRMFMRSS